jgi:hypothetical protein
MGEGDGPGLDAGQDGARILAGSPGRRTSRLEEEEFQPQTIESSSESERVSNLGLQILDFEWFQSVFHDQIH